MKIGTLLHTLLLSATLLFSSTAVQAKTVIEDDQYIIFYHNDVLGSPVVVTDHNGNTLWHEHSDPFGRARDRVMPTGKVILNDRAGSRKGYTGHLKDAGSDLVYMKARFYDPVVGRFYSNDPVGFMSNSPEYFNRYSYVGNRPFNYIDSTGMIGDNWAEEDENYSCSTCDNWANNKSLHFDGDSLQVQDGDGNVIEDWPATSGPAGSSPEDSDIPDYGPTPEGKYNVRPEDANYRTWLKALFGWGSVLDWGKVRTYIRPLPEAYIGRDGMYIHGGGIAGSIGCIDLTDNNDKFHDWLKKQTGTLPLSVDYPGYEPNYSY